MGNWFFVVTLKYLGVGAAYTLLAFVVPYFVLFAPASTAVSWRYHRHILHYGKWRTLRAIYMHFFTFGQSIIDRVAVKHAILKPYTFHYGNYTEFLSVLDAGKGAIIIGAHVGAWEMGAPFFHQYAQNINVVMLDAEYEKIKHVIENGSSSFGYKVIPLTDDGLESIIKIKAALDKREYVCFQGDRFMDSSNSVPLTFMGHEARFPKGLFKLAIRLRVPVVFYFAMRSARRTYTFKFHIAQNVASESSLMAEYAGVLEQVVSEYPQQWYNFYDFWTSYKN